MKKSIEFRCFFSFSKAFFKAFCLPQNLPIYPKWSKYPKGITLNWVNLQKLNNLLTNRLENDKMYLYRFLFREPNITRKDVLL